MPALVGCPVQALYTAFRSGMTMEEINDITNIDPWYVPPPSTRARPSPSFCFLRPSHFSWFLGSLPGLLRFALWLTPASVCPGRFLSQLEELMAAEKFVQNTPLENLNTQDWTSLKQRGFSDLQIARASGHAWQKVRKRGKGKRSIAKGPGNKAPCGIRGTNP